MTLPENITGLSHTESMPDADATIKVWWRAFLPAVTTLGKFLHDLFGKSSSHWPVSPNRPRHMREPCSNMLQNSAVPFSTTKHDARQWFCLG